MGLSSNCCNGLRTGSCPGYALNCSHALCPQVHTVPIKVTGKCGSVIIRLVPAPRGAGIVAARVPKKVR